MANRSEGMVGKRNHDDVPGHTDSN